MLIWKDEMSVFARFNYGVYLAIVLKHFFSPINLVKDIFYRTQRFCWYETCIIQFTHKFIISHMN